GRTDGAPSRRPRDRPARPHRARSGRGGRAALRRRRGAGQGGVRRRAGGRARAVRPVRRRRLVRRRDGRARGLRRAGGSHRMSGLPSQLWWWVARATGIVAWAFATAAVAWGLALSGRLVRRRRLPAWILDLHRYLGTLTVAFLAVHVLALVADGYVQFGPKEIFVPMASAWRPGAVTWGV